MEERKHPLSEQPGADSRRIFLVARVCGAPPIRPRKPARDALGTRASRGSPSGTADVRRGARSRVGVSLHPPSIRNAVVLAVPLAKGKSAPWISGVTPHTLEQEGARRQAAACPRRLAELPARQGPQPCRAPSPETQPAPNGAGCEALWPRGHAPQSSRDDQNVREPTIMRDQLPGWMPSAFSGVTVSHLHGWKNSVAPIRARLPGSGNT